VANGNFEEQLRQNGVILSAKERRARIETGIARLLSGKGLRVKPDESLLDTLVYITELPTPILGSFAEKYLELPQEILITVMRHHQKNFSVEREDGSLAPNFIAVMNIDADPDGLVRQGNEYVLRDRFNDARFFWEVDQKKKLEDRLDDLAKVTFQAKLGSYLEKTTRVVELARAYGPAVERAALLSKTDLTTDMVKEFTDLQGIIGGLYAKAQGEPESVWRAIYDQYKPVSMEDEIPRTREGQLLSYADKWDTLGSCFRVGLIPTGSKDPFALRRAAQGVVRILAEAKLDIQLDLVPGDPLHEFMRDRVDYYFREVRGFKYDEVRACMGAGWNLLPDLEARLLRVQAIRSTPDFEPLAASFKRIKNILTQASFRGGGEIDQSLLEPGPEQELYAEYSGHLGEPLESRIASLRRKVDAFFDKVLVNAKDEAVRQNRLTLLHNLLSEFSSIADFSEIVTEK
jgi:glycyl-tRNA synthetase beta chain